MRPPSLFAQFKLLLLVLAVPRGLIARPLRRERVVSEVHVGDGNRACEGVTSRTEPESFDPHPAEPARDATFRQRVHSPPFGDRASGHCLARLEGEIHEYAEMRTETRGASRLPAPRRLPFGDYGLNQPMKMRTRITCAANPPVTSAANRYRFRASVASSMNTG